jgi:membrane-bound lytic murein transglycosylase B
VGRLSALSHSSPTQSMNRRHFLGRSAALTASLGSLALPAWAQGTSVAAPVIPPATPANSNGFAPYAGRPEVQAWAEAFAQSSGWGMDRILGVLGTAQSNDTVIRLMQPAPTGFKRSWKVYRSRFVEPIRIRAALKFWEENARWLSQARERFGVPPEIVVGIIGVETIFGRDMGSFRVLDVLMTLSFDYLRRAELYRSELGQYLLLCDENGLTHGTYQGSFAAAIGIPQFIPSSIRRFAVDLDGDGRIDLRASPADAIGSVARYLSDHGWQADQPISVAVRVSSSAEQIKQMLDAGPLPGFTLEQLTARGVQPIDPVPDETRFLLVDLPTGDEVPEYRVGTPNFYAITRYNRNFFYAAAVHDLATAVRVARKPA